MWIENEDFYINKIEISNVIPIISILICFVIFKRKCENISKILLNIHWLLMDYGLYVAPSEFTFLKKPGKF